MFGDTDVPADDQPLVKTSFYWRFVMRMSKWKSTVAGALIGVGAIALPSWAEDGKGPANPGTPQMQLPPGWTMEDVQACMIAATPGEQHKYLAGAAGEWEGKNTTWMFAGAEPVQTQSRSVVTPMLDGRFVKVEMAGEMPGMGPYHGFAIYGFDNVSGEFTGTWVDNCGTGMSIGKGQLSSDGKVMSWTYQYNCPMTKKPAVLRQVETVTGPNSRTMELYGTDPKSGKEWKMMHAELTRKAAGSAAAAGER